MTSHDSLRRARGTFWVLALVAVAAAGSLSAALDAPAGTVTGLRVAVSGLALTVTFVLAARVMIVLERARRRALGSGSKD
jgi:hypothetical protein